MVYVCFFGSNGYEGCGYREYAEYDNSVTEEEINQDSYDYAIDNAETYAHAAFGWGESYTDEEYEEYLDAAESYCSWRYCTEEEYKAMVNR